jgi:hypothetical protein
MAAAEYFCSFFPGMIFKFTFQDFILSLVLDIRLRLSPQRHNLHYQGNIKFSHLWLFDAILEN